MMTVEHGWNQEAGSARISIRKECISANHWPGGGEMLLKKMPANHAFSATPFIHIRSDAR
jgi:hypothetical protein